MPDIIHFNLSGAGYTCLRINLFAVSLGAVKLPGNSLILSGLIFLVYISSTKTSVHG